MREMWWWSEEPAEVIEEIICYEIWHKTKAVCNRKKTSKTR